MADGVGEAPERLPRGIRGTLLRPARLPGGAVAERAPAATEPVQGGGARRQQVLPARRPPPRILALHPLLIGAEPRWDAAFAHAAALGFDTALIAPPFLPGADGSLFRTADHDRIHPALGWQGDADALLAALAMRARRHGLALHLDLVADRVAAGGTLGARPGWFAPAADAEAPPDPRRAPPEPGTLQARWQDSVVSEALGAWWLERLRRWSQAGVAGLRCLAPSHVPGTAWRRWTDALPTLRFLAWTPGLSPAECAALRGLGFAGVFDSLAWWQPGDDWLVPEHDALADIAPVIATLEAPFATRFAARFPTREVAARAAARQVRIAAGTGAGLLVPMGFELGAQQAMDPSRGTPAAWDRLLAAPPSDIRMAVREANSVLAAHPAACGRLRSLAGPGAPVTAVLRASAGGGAAILTLANGSLDEPAAARLGTLLPGAGRALARLRRPGCDATQQLGPTDTILLDPGDAMLLEADPARPVHDSGGGSATDAATRPRIAIEAVQPGVDAGRFAVKRLVGEAVAVEADIIMDGHETLGAELLWRTADEADWRRVPMRHVANDRWTAAFPLERPGRHLFVVEAWHDVFGSYLDALGKKLAAGQDLTLELEEGRLLVAAAAGRRPGDAALRGLAERLTREEGERRLARLRDPTTRNVMEASCDRPHGVRSATMPVEADRTAARFASWYEMFPRSQSGDPARHGSFADVIAQLPRIRAMGFDVLYLPPIHPIGRAFRKGRNNTLTPGPEDPGSPYAIGSEAGGHDAIHPALGSLEDFRRLVAAAAEHGIELALDFAIQCSPDHPWLREHPDWFDWRPDGTIKYAENPPKRYQDIVNVDFYAKGAVPGLWQALRDVVLFWAREGVRLFRVDNPHTKPLPFWEWMIAEVRAHHPDAIFLAEAFTKPKMMYRLAKLGFGQSYTYFTWRNEKREIEDYLTELNTPPVSDVFRPHFFVNTPDINPVFLQQGGRAAHLIRAALATTLSGLWGMYQGFELCEATPLPGREEYMDSEKYEIRAWPARRPGDIVDEITRLNAIRRANPALQSHLGIAFYAALNNQVLWYRKATEDRTNVLLCAVSLDPHGVQEAEVELPLWEWGLPDDAALQLEPLMPGGTRVTWEGKRQRVRLDPAVLPFAIWRVRGVA